jgi:hypothetical protein
MKDQNQETIEEVIQNYIKKNLTLEVREREYMSDVSYSREIYVELVLNGKVISSQEIPKWVG